MWSNNIRNVETIVRKNFPNADKNLSYVPLQIVNDVFIGNNAATVQSLNSFFTSSEMLHVKLLCKMYSTKNLHVSLEKTTHDNFIIDMPYFILWKFPISCLVLLERLLKSEQNITLSKARLDYHDQIRFFLSIPPLR